MNKSIRTALHIVAMLAAGLAMSWAGISAAQDKGANSPVYELRTYTTLPGRLPALNRRFSDHTMRFFAKHGMKNVMYWIPTDDARKDNTLIYVLLHESQAAADKSWKDFQADPEWVKVRDASEADGKILVKAPDRVFMRMTDYSPGK
jgi:hypothetical protein